MSCMGLRKLTTFLDSLKNLPLNMLASLIPKDLPQLSMLGGMASGMATVQAMASASAQAAWIISVTGNPSSAYWMAG